ncbi:uncharacterized protein RHIMIDRAFT_26630 [Rhizopus microsporus ATCC 52813]|uniref:Uncharacterized protein n=1 Tax=Rhizopus microsporus ATCC 52813 TaxID=1340429 RepID=A0A2G4SQ21_RHIZD|nr:uncharacterized protein RHIMIDRAFT_26630 [Rhizopus microsporus ATCC 52813]PHZ10878.1 hypothetical protein RHIMIDRAFT_26630 [Rhizopus microsporus ATCC 52813]
MDSYDLDRKRKAEEDLYEDVAYKKIQLENINSEKEEEKETDNGIQQKKSPLLLLLQSEILLPLQILSFLLTV